jgi:hypothetical protein
LETGVPEVNPIDHDEVAPLTRGGIIGNWHWFRRSKVAALGVAPLTRGGIIGNRKLSNQLRRNGVQGRPSNQGRNHWKRPLVVPGSALDRSRPSNQGRNHWKPHQRGIPVKPQQVAPLTRGGIIGNIGEILQAAIKRDR